jgi:hypothetical protein
MIRSMEWFTFIYCIQSKAMYHCIPMEHGKYEYKRLPMCIEIAWFLMFFKTSCLSLSKIWNILRQLSYLDDLLILTNSSFKDHLLKLEMVLARLSTAGMRVNISKSNFFAEQIEYLAQGNWISIQGNQPMRNKVEMTAILNMKAPKTRKEESNKLRKFIAIVNYYRDMWFRTSELLARFH